MTNSGPAQANLGRLLLNAFRWVDALFESRMRARGWKHLPRSNSLVLPHLMSGGIRPADIAKKAGVTRQAIHQVVEDLENLGLIEMQADPKDRRSKLVVITSRGRKFDAAVHEVSTEIEELLSARIGLVAVSNLRMGLGADWGDPALDRDKPPVNLWWI